MGGALSLPTVKFDWSKTITGKSRKLVVQNEKNELNLMFYYSSVVVLCTLVGYWVIIRSTELFSLFPQSITHFIMFLGVIAATASLFLKPPKNTTLLGRRLTVIVLALMGLKREIDWDLGKNLISHSVDDGGKYDLQGRVVIVTGANSGVGLGASQLFASYGATVVMACRSERRCNDAKNTIISNLASRTSYVGPLVPAIMDLSDLTSVQSFANKMKNDYDHIDILVNNAGAIPLPGARTAQGLELSWGSMHMGHFALTKWLLPQLLNPRPRAPRAHPDAEGLESGDAFAEDDMHAREMAKYDISDSSRIVYVSSDAFLAGSFHDTLFKGNGTGLGDLHGEIIDNCPADWPCCPIGNCPDSNSYARAKLSNFLHAYELQKRVDHYAQQKPLNTVRRVVTSAIHPGAVATNIHPFFSSEISNWAMRSHMEAGKIVVYAAMENTYVPSSFIDCMSVPHDLFNYFTSEGNDGIEKHTGAWPESKELPFYKTSQFEASGERVTADTAARPAGVKTYGMSYHDQMFKKTTLVHDGRKWGIMLELRNFLLNMPMSLISLVLWFLRNGILTIQAILAHLDYFDLFELRTIAEEASRVETAELASLAVVRQQVSTRLWEVSASIIESFEAGVDPAQYLSTVLQFTPHAKDLKL